MFYVYGVFCGAVYVFILLNKVVYRSGNWIMQEKNIETEKEKSSYVNYGKFVIVCSSLQMFRFTYLSYMVLILAATSAVTQVKQQNLINRMFN